MNGKYIPGITILMFIVSCNENKVSVHQAPIEVTDSTKPALFAEGIISTGDYETHPAFSPSGDTVYFLKCTGDLGMSTICVSYKKDDKWSAPGVASFSGKYLDVDPFVTNDGNTVYFSSNRPLNERDSVKPDWDIWKVEKAGSSGWGKPVHLDFPVNSSLDEYYPTISDNGTLYFGSAREGGKGGSDIYKAILSVGKYRVVENAGDSVNTANNEYEPFIARDESYLIFMATIPNGLTNADFYISYNNKGNWSKPVKLPVPVNSEVTEWSPKVTRDDKYFFFGSTRSRMTGEAPQTENIQQLEERLNHAGNNGLSDIYYIRFSEIVKK